MGRFKTLLLTLLFLLVHVSLNSQEKIQLRWNPSTDNVGVEGYNIWLNAEYYGTTSDTFFIFPTLEAGTYAMAVSAFDAAGNESEKSLTLLVDIGDLSVPSIPDSLMIVYPNPTYNGNFVVHFGKPIKNNTTLQILSTNGKVLYERSIPPGGGDHTEYFDMQYYLAAGIYVLSLNENGTRIKYSVLTISKSGTPIRSVRLYRNNKNGVWQIPAISYGEIMAVWK